MYLALQDMQFCIQFYVLIGEDMVLFLLLISFALRMKIDFLNAEKSFNV